MDYLAWGNPGILLACYLKRPQCYRNRGKKKKKDARKGDVFLVESPLHRLVIFTIQVRYFEHIKFIFP